MKIDVDFLPVVQLNSMLVLIQFFVVDLDIYYKEILFQVLLIEHLYKLFELVLMVLNCFYLREKKRTIFTIDQDRKKIFFLLRQRERERAMTRLNVLYPIRSMRKRRYWMNNDMLIYHRQ